MLDSILKTLAVPIIAGNDEPAMLHQAASHPTRVAVRNVGGNLVFLAHTVGDLQGSVAPSAVFQLPADTEVVVVLAARQMLLAAGQGGGGQVSVAISEALPPSTWMAS